MQFKWYLTIDIEKEEPEWEDCSDKAFHCALAKFYEAKEAFYSYLDSEEVKYKVISSEVK